MLSKEGIVMTDISIIIPIYKGKQYITYWLDIIQKNMSKFKDVQQDFCELIFVNDFPEEKLELEDMSRFLFTMKVLNSDINRGIHGARVYGIQHAVGQHVVMLDQDDKISEYYLISQYEKIGEADAIVCNGYKEQYCITTKRTIYRDAETQSKVKEYDSFMNRNHIISPGQVMLRKSAIPQEWVDNIMTKNGTDDYFLWLLMLYNNRTVNINEEILYTHVGHAGNTSSDRKMMNNSTKEMLAIIRSNGFLPEDDIIKMEKMVFADSDELRFLEMFYTYDRWLYLKNRGLTVADFLKKNGYRNVVIYGMGYLGNRLHDELIHTDIEVLAAIDRDAIRITHEIPVVSYEYEQYKPYLDKADILIVTINEAKKEIEATIKKNFDIPIYSLDEIIIKLIAEINE